MARLSIAAPSTLVLLGLLSCTAPRERTPASTRPAASEERTAERDFLEGNALAARGDHQGALAHYRRGLVKSAFPGLLYNAGLAAYLTGRFEEAVEHWKRLEEMDPSDWQARTKLIQAYQGLGDTARREAARVDLLALRERTEDEDWKSQPLYCRDPFVAGGRRVMALEYFEMTGDMAIRYSFCVLKDEGEEVDFRITLGSYELTNRIARETGSPGEGERRFHLDGYYEGGGHRLFRFFRGEPSYDEVREIVVRILETEADRSGGKAAPGKGSSRSRGTALPAVPAQGVHPGGAAADGSPSPAARRLPKLSSCRLNI